MVPKTEMTPNTGTSILIICRETMPNQALNLRQPRATRSADGFGF